jgi:alpha-L-rhamnosidase
MSESFATGQSTVDIVNLQVEYQSEPINAPLSEPRFSWRAETDRRGARQTAYRVIVARSNDMIAKGRGNLWDSGKVESPTSTNVTYDGVPLSSDEDYYWTVRIWNENGESSEWADPATFSTALAVDHEWEGDWIGYQPDAGDSNGYRSQWHSANADVSADQLDSRRNSGDDEEWVQVDLGELREVDQIELYPANPFNGPKTPDGMPVSAVYSATTDPDRHVTVSGPGGFGFPAGYRIEVTDDADFEDARTLVEHADVDNPGSDVVSIDVDADARYVRVTATDLYELDPTDPPEVEGPQRKTEYLREERRPWRVFALAALAVRDSDGGDLAAERQVTASSSIEQEGWGRANLVDGEYASRTAPGSPLLRTDIDLAKDVKRARAHVCALGYGELYVNGERVGDDVLNPGWTQYDERCLYSTYDVTGLLRKGKNALGLWLGRGWFGRNARDWTGFGSPRALLQLNVEYEDGTTRSVSTDSSWRSEPSPILENDLYDGEVYDARKESDGWNEPGFDDSDWESTNVVEAPGGDLVPQRTPPIRVTETLKPIEVLNCNEGPIVDFGQNLVGWLELTVDDAEAGDEIELKHAEMLLNDGSLALEDLRSADATDTYVARGDDEENYEPRFTYHGFRYAQITGYPSELDPDNVCAKVVHTDVEPIGSFDCSNEDLSQVQHNAEWGLTGNLHSVLTDCPQRDERFGWTGDNHIAARALMYNFDSVGFYEKWMGDHDDIQSKHGYVSCTIPYGYGSVPEDPTWGITRVTIPWHLYRHYGDTGVLERHYEGMRRYLDYWYSESDDGIIPAEYANYGDWLAFENTDGRRGLPYSLFTTAFQYHTTNLFAKIADEMERHADAERYAARAERIADAFSEKFFDAETGEYRSGTQSSYAVPLYFGLVPEEHVDAVVDNLVEKVHSDDGKLRTGFLGTRPLIHTLVDHGHPEIAYEIVSQPERPGWVYMVRQGATTMWERWDSDDQIGEGMNSFNHSPFNFVSEWFYYTLAGLRFDESMHGLGEITIAPALVDDLNWATGEIKTVNGSLSSHWERTDDGIHLDIKVPWNTVATVRLPIDGSGLRVHDRDIPIGENDSTALPEGVRVVRSTGGDIEIEVGAGSYQFDLSR